MSLPFDQQVTLTPKTQVPTLDVVVYPPWCEKPSGSFQEMSPPWQRTPSAAFVDVSTFCGCSNFLDGGLSLPFDQHMMLSPKKLSPNFRWGGLSPPFDQQVTLTPKTQVPTLGVVVSPPWQRTPSAAFVDVSAF